MELALVLLVVMIGAGAIFYAGLRGQRRESPAVAPGSSGTMPPAAPGDDAGGEAGGG